MLKWFRFLEANQPVVLRIVPWCAVLLPFCMRWCCGGHRCVNPYEEDNKTEKSILRQFLLLWGKVIKLWAKLKEKKYEENREERKQKLWGIGKTKERKTDLKRRRRRLTITGPLGILRLADMQSARVIWCLAFGTTIKLGLAWHQLSQDLVAFDGKTLADASWVWFAWDFSLRPPWCEVRIRTLMAV